MYEFWEERRLVVDSVNAGPEVDEVIRHMQRCHTLRNRLAADPFCFDSHDPRHELENDWGDETSIETVRRLATCQWYRK